MPSPPSGNLILWLEADVGLYKDTAGTTPATADGDLVALWKDQSGLVNDVLQATSGNRPVLKTGILNAKPVLRCAHTSTQYLATSGSVVHGISTGGFWLAAVFANTGSSGNFSAFFSIGSFAPAFYYPTTSGGAYNFYLGGTHTFTSTINGTLSYLAEMARVSGVVKLWQSSGGAAPTLDATTFSLGGSIASGKLYVGWDNAANDGFNGDIAEVLLYNTALNSTDQASLESYLLAKYWGNRIRRVICTGQI